MGILEHKHFNDKLQRTFISFIVTMVNAKIPHKVDYNNVRTWEDSYKGNGLNMHIITSI